MDFATQKAEYVRTYNKYKGTHSLGRSAKSSHSTEAWILKGLPSEPSKSVNQLLGACGLFNVWCFFQNRDSTNCTDNLFSRLIFMAMKKFLCVSSTKMS